MGFAALERIFNGDFNAAITHTFFYKNIEIMKESVWKT